MKNIKFLLVLALIVAVGASGFFWNKSRLFEKQVKGEPALVPTNSPTSQPTPNFPQTVGNFLVTDKAVCNKDGKVSVYFFGSSSCPHCVWEKPIIEKVAQKFSGVIDFHENIDVQTDSDIFNQYNNINPGYVPFIVLGCKYARVGAGENLGKDEAESKVLEEQALTAIICKLTDSQPTSVCASVKDKVAEVK